MQFRSDVTQKIKIWAAGIWGVFLGGGLESRFPVESNGDTAGLYVVFVAYCLEDEE